MAIDAFRMRKSESVLLLGQSGSGKSTLLSLICGTIAPQAGQVSVNGTNLTALSGPERDQFRAETIGVIFQQFNLLPFARVADNILLPLQFAPRRRHRTGDTWAQAERLCAALSLPSDILRRRADTLSVGQQQRVAVARALIGGPPLLVADEPTSALDAETQSVFLDLLFNQVAAHGQSLLMVSHDPRLAERFDRVVRMEEIVSSERSPA